MAKNYVLIIAIIFLLFVVYGVNGYSRAEYFSVPTQEKLKSCLNISESKDDDRWEPWAACYKNFDGPDEADMWLKCVKNIKEVNEQEKKACISALDTPQATPSSASGDYDTSSTMFDLFSQIAPVDMAETIPGMTEHNSNSSTEYYTNVPTQERVDGYSPLGTLYGTPYSDTYEGFSNSGHQMARLCVPSYGSSEIARFCMGDPFGTCKRKYGTSAWQGYSQCVLTGEGLQEPY